jgi:tetratricopeptide (TPR) repeat protein
VDYALPFTRAFLNLGLAIHMPRFTLEQIRSAFANGKEFNDIFDVFEDALAQGIQDLELYRLLFWNSALAPDELCLFGGKLACVFPHLAYDTYMWLANVFEVTHSAYDNYELAIKYYNKAAAAKPTEVLPYLNAADCYDPDLNIPPFDVLEQFLRKGVNLVTDKKTLLHRLSYLYQMRGDQKQADLYRKLADDIERIQN